MHCGLNRHILSRPDVELFSDSGFLGDSDEGLAPGWASMGLYLLVKIPLGHN